MAFCNFLLYIFIIFVNQMSKNIIFALNEEAIIAGNLVRQSILKHQAAIIGEQNGTNFWELLCGAGIVDDLHVVGGAHCFLDHSNKLKNLTFYVIVGTNDLKNLGIRIEVDLIFMTNYNRSTSLGDIAVVKLKHSLQLNINTRLVKLELAAPENLHQRHIFLISGYGATKVQTKINSISGKEQRVMHDTDLLLRTSIVKVVDNVNCQNVVPLLSSSQMCGIIIPKNRQEPSGLCKGDRGNPLVAGRTLIGIASKGPVNCDNRFTGTLYTKVANYAKFIRFIIQERFHKIKANLYIHKNNPQAL